MPRQARLRLAEVTLHAIQRGNNRSACFLDDNDRLVYLAHLGAAAGLCGCAVHAYVLMTNHVHLLLTPRSDDGASRMMRNLGQRYVQYFNRKHNRSWSLWEGRFRSCPTQGERYVLACYRYIEMNPVRAGLVAQPGDYAWSSYQVNAMGQQSTFVVAHEEWTRLGTSWSHCLGAYRALFDDVLDPVVVATIRNATNGNIALGDRKFTGDLEAAIGRRVTQGKRGRPFVNDAAAAPAGAEIA